MLIYWMLIYIAFNSVIQCKKTGLRNELKVDNMVTSLATYKPVMDQFFRKYPSYNEIFGQLYTWSKLFPNFVTLDFLGKTSEKRPLMVILLTDRSSGSIPVVDRPTIWLNGGQIARDWITITSLMWSAFQILQGGIQNDPKFANPLQSFVFLISPCINPDGYEYSKNVDRSWMKNRQNYVNLDRNWNFHWTVDWQLNDPKDAEYSGTSPFSESETQLYSEYIIEKVKNRHAGLDFNSNGGRILRTWGYTKQLPKEYLRLDDLGKKLTDSTLTLGTNFTYNSIAQVDQKSGNLCDWMVGAAKMLCYRVDLAEKDNYEIPPEKIPHYGNIALEIIVEFSNYLMQNIIPS